MPELDTKNIHDVYHFGLLSEIAQDGVALHEVYPDGTLGRFLHVNPALCRLLGYSDEELHGLSPYDIQAPEQAIDFPEELSEFLQKGALLFQKTLITKAGERIPTEVNVKGFEREGQTYVLAIVRDIRERTQIEERLRRTEGLHRTFAKNLPGAAMLLFDKDLCFQLVEGQALQAIGISRESIEGKCFSELPAQIRHEYEDLCRMVLQGQSFYTVRSYGDRLFHLRLVPIVEDVKGITGGMVLLLDGTDQIRAEEAVRESEQRFREMAEIVPAILFITQADSRLIYSNSRFTEITGMPTDQALGHGWLETIHPEDREFVRNFIQQGLIAKETITVEERVRCIDGTYRWFRSNAYPVFDDEGKLLKWIGTAVDIHDLKTARDDLRRINETLEQLVEVRAAKVKQQADQLQALAAELTTVEQRERSRLASILHDHVQQLLVGAQMQLNFLKHHTDSPFVIKTIETTNAILHETITLARSLSVELSPPILQHSGLAAGLSWLAERMMEKQNFKVHFSAEEDSEPESEVIRFLLFECARELLLNSLKHSGTKEAWLTLRRPHDHYLSVTVEDHGNGFDPAQYAEKENQRGFGLFSVQQRLNYFGGCMDIETAPSHGTKVVLWAPMAWNENR